LRAEVQVARDNEERGLRTWFEELCERYRSVGEGNEPEEALQERNAFVGEVRQLLASTCLGALEPDVIILDEFQRFKHLLDRDEEDSQLAQQFFRYSDESTTAKVILLSATPYKAYTRPHESEKDQHYEDFIRTLAFLQDDERDTAEFSQLLTDYRKELFRASTGDRGRLLDLKRDIEGRLRKVMVRTERLAVSPDRDGMLKEVPSPDASLEARDLGAYIAYEEVARVLRQGEMLRQRSMLEYWKSAPYLLNFMRDYQVKRAFGEALKDTDFRSELADALADIDGALFPWDDLESYARIDPGNARLRALFSDTVDSGAWQLLWMPPSLPYYRPKPDGPFASFEDGKLTKRLVFSAWKVVPRVVAGILSYEAERQMTRAAVPNAKNTPEARERRRGQGRLRGMPIVALAYPCFTLATRCDPLVLFDELRREHGGPPPLERLQKRIEAKIEELLARIPQTRAGGGDADTNWYWAAPILLDQEYHRERVRSWLTQDKLEDWARRPGVKDDEEAAPVEWTGHIERVLDLVQGRLELGRRPDDLAPVLAQIAIGGPAVTMLRALSRTVVEPEPAADPTVTAQAARLGYAFTTVFSSPDVHALVQAAAGRDQQYWRRVLDYCVDGGLQAVLDEYVHLLRISLGHLDPKASCEEVVPELARAMDQAFKLTASSMTVDEVVFTPQGRRISKEKERHLRVRFALRYGEQVPEGAEDTDQVTRPKQVMDAFNSPFWPFVLATTSIGQEGLDFHFYCHAVVHWNLPSNPVDLEQREGRVHRFKGHAIRKNVAATHAASVDFSDGRDPWDKIFCAARAQFSDQEPELTPFWVFPIEEGAFIERHVPALPLSREVERIAALRRSLAMYRMVFGQNRQEDLLAFLLSKVPGSETDKLADDLRIDLSPPEVGPDAMTHGPDRGPSPEPPPGP